MANSGLYSTGQGGKVDVTFHVEGTATVDGTEVKVDTTGYISVSSSEWKGLERPDYSNITYYWPQNPPVNLSISVPSSIAGMPDDGYFVFGASPTEKQVGMNLTTYKDIADTALDYAIKGIFWVNEKLAGWAFGKII